MVETYSRICIDDDLKKAGWDPKDTGQVQTSYHINLSEEDQKFYGKKSLQADYVLKDTRGIPIAVIEAKKMKLDPYLAMDQAKRYAKVLNVRFVYTGNGKITYFFDRDLEGGQVQVVDDFASREDLMRLITLRDEKRRKPFSEILIDINIAGGFDEELQKERYYQKECIEAVCASLEAGKKKLLVHMATGTGKTRVMIALVKRLIQSGRLNRCLFLVDRIELARQARRAFREYYREATTVILKSSNIENEKHKQIHICTLQTLLNLYRFRPFWTLQRYLSLRLDPGHCFG
jgi:type I restriction enzyme R subunit